MRSSSFVTNGPRAAAFAAVLTLAVPVAAKSPTNAPAALKTKLAVTVVAKGLENPWGLQFLPDGRMLVTERGGRLRIVGKDGKVSAAVDGVPKVMAQGQGGLLDVRLAPDFATSGTMYLSFSEPREGGKSSTSIGKGKLVLDGDKGRLDGFAVIFRQAPAHNTTFHFGSRIVPNADGSLFVTTGDRGTLKMEAQNPASHIGKVLRIMPDGTAAAANPKSPGWAAEVWSIGHRNIQGAALDASGALWTVEHGARGGDELNKPEKGKNYGWPIISYGRDYSGAKIGEGTEKSGLEQPVYYWDPSIATSGLAFYDGALFAGWKGNALVGGLSGSLLSRLTIENGAVVAEEKLLADRGERVRDVRVGPDGAVYVLTDERDGKVLRLAPGG